MGKYLVASGLASLLFSGPDPSATGARTQSVSVWIEMPAAAEGAPVPAQISCVDGQTRSIEIPANGQLELDGLAARVCSVTFAAGGDVFGANFTVGAHGFETLTPARMGPVHAADTVQASSDAVVEGRTLSVEEMRAVPVGGDTSRDFTAVVELAGTSAGVAVAEGFQAGTLTAGAVDDLADAGAFARFVRALPGQVAATSQFGTTWAALRLADPAGRPIAGVRVRVGDTTLRTRADGRVVFVAGYDGIADLARARAIVDEHQTVRLQPGKTTTRTLPARQRRNAAADVLLVLDTTGSMGDELAYLQVELEAIFDDVAAKHRGVDLRWGLILYRDQGDEYVVRGVDFTSDFEGFLAALAQQSANGGGDMPEAVHSAMAAATRLDWRGAAQASRIVIHLADAPPHPAHLADALEAVDALREQGTAVYPVAASGLDGAGEFFMRAAALMTGGQYIFLTDDSGYGGTHREATASCFRVHTLASVLTTVLDAELAGRRPSLPRGERGSACPQVGVPRVAPGPSRRSVSRSLFDDDAAARHLHQPFVRRKFH